MSSPPEEKTNGFWHPSGDGRMDNEVSYKNKAES
jgi:hypothetical protein